MPDATSSTMPRPTPEVRAKRSWVERTLRRLKQHQKAAAIFEQVLASYPQHKARAQVLEELVACYEALQQPALAQKARRRYAPAADKAAVKADDSPALLDEADAAPAEAEAPAVAK